MAKKTQPPPRNFEEALGELERILGDMESGHVGLEDSLNKYERGSFLLQHCRSVLNAAEKQIELLSQAPGGVLQSTIAPAAPTPPTNSSNNSSPDTLDANSIELA